MRVLWPATLLLLVFPVLPTRAQQAAPSSYQLAAVQVTGTKRYTPADVGRLSGLEPGQMVTVERITSGAAHLGTSGLFKSVKFRYVTSAGRVAVIFDVEDAEWTVPVTFDNLVWFSDEEITNAVKADVPTFDGTLPPAEGAPDLVMRSIQKLLESKKISGRAAFQPQTDLVTKKLSYLFAVQDPAPVLCGLMFPGATPPLERELVEASKAALGQSYSRFYLSSMSAGTLLDVYHRRGHWRAAFRSPAPTIDSPSCKGVSAALSVVEGAVYSFDKAQWAGNGVLQTSELDVLFAMKGGEVADSSKIDEGLRRIHVAYGKKGYLTTSTSAAPRLNDETKRALFDVRVEEGPQFFMGALAFEGLAAADAARLTRMWKLAAGAPYDNSYESDFIFKDVMPLLPRGTKTPTVRESLDSDKHIVNVTITFSS